MFAAICTLAFKNVIAVPPAFAKIDCRNSCWDVGFCGRRQICFSLLNKLRFHFCARRKEFVTFLPFRGIAECVAGAAFGPNVALQHYETIGEVAVEAELCVVFGCVCTTVFCECCREVL